MNERDEKRNKNRTRKNRIVFCVDDSELKFIQAKMEILNIKNRGAYLRKMAIDGECIRYDYSEFAAEVKRSNYLLGTAASNINQLVKRVNSTGNFYEEDMQELLNQLDIMWERQREIMRLFLKETEGK